MKKKAITLILTLMCLVSSSQKTDKKKILIVSIDDSEELLGHVEVNGGCSNEFYIKNMSGIYHKIGFRSFKPSYTGSLSDKEPVILFKELMDDFLNEKKHSREFFNYFSQYFLLFTKKEGNLNRFYEVHGFQSAI